MTEGYLLGMMLLYLFFKPDPATAILSGWFMGISCSIWRSFSVNSVVGVEHTFFNHPSNAFCGICINKTFAHICKQACLIHKHDAAKCQKSQTTKVVVYVNSIFCLFELNNRFSQFFQ